MKSRFPFLDVVFQPLFHGSVSQNAPMELWRNAVPYWDRVIGGCLQVCADYVCAFRLIVDWLTKPSPLDIPIVGVKFALFVTVLLIATLIAIWQRRAV